VPANLGRIASPIRPDLIFDRDRENSSPNPVLLSNVASHLIVKGYWEADAYFSLFGFGHCLVLSFADLRIFEWWNQPPTSPLTEDSQGATIVDLDVHGPAILGRAQNTKYAVVFNGYDVKKYSSFIVPPNGLVVFEVALTSLGYVNGGLVEITIEGGDYSVLCPFLQFQVSEVVRKGPPI
jgi:hypothetical protein